MKCTVIKAKDKRGIPAVEMDVGDAGVIVTSPNATDIGVPVLRARLGNLSRIGTDWFWGDLSEIRVEPFEDGDSIVFHDE